MAVTQLVIDLKGRTALVTGGSRGIGRSIAWALASSGANVLITSRKQADLDGVVADAEEARLPGAIAAYAANSGVPGQAEAAVAFALGHFGALDILVNNAAANPYFGNLVDLDPARAAKTVAVNQYGPLVWIANAWRAWMEQHGGTILNISSIGAFGTEPGIGYYNATKAAAEYLTRQLAYELAPRVRVNSVAPGIVKTYFSRALWEGREEQILRSVPMGRFGEPEDIANAALFLVSDAAAWITGQTLAVDGGSLVVPAADAGGD